MIGGVVASDRGLGWVFLKWLAYDAFGGGSLIYLANREQYHRSMRAFILIVVNWVACGGMRPITSVLLISGSGVRVPHRPPFFQGLSWKQLSPSYLWVTNGLQKRLA